MSCDNSSCIKVDENANSEKVESNEKINNRTHHTRFFEKLYGNLETTNCEKEFESKNINHNNNNDSNVEYKFCANKIAINSPSESSSSSDVNVTRFKMF